MSQVYKEKILSDIDDIPVDVLPKVYRIIHIFSDNPRLSRKALRAFEKTIENGSIIIPIIVLAEIMYIAKKGRI